jgi:hypothetical protein
MNTAIITATAMSHGIMARMPVLVMCAVGHGKFIAKE